MNSLSEIKMRSTPNTKMISMILMILILLLIFPAQAYQNNHLPITEYPIFIKSLKECGREEPLGMASGKIQDWQITASSTFPKGWDKFCGLEYARLYQPNNYTWCSKFKTSTEWLQVDLGLVSKVTGFMTQGRGDGLAWVSSYLVSYSLDGSSWNYVMDFQGNGRVFDGNIDSYRVKHAYLDDAMFARFVKFHVVNWNGHPSMRVEILGCQVCDDNIGNPPYVKLSASSEKHSVHTCQAEDGHVVTKKSWCPKENNSNQWLRFDLGPPTLITGVVTMGKGDGKKKHWVSRYLISYSNDSVLWHYYKDASQTDTKLEAAVEGQVKLIPNRISKEGLEFGGNSDKNSPRIHYLNLPFVARYVRFHPTKWNFQISMRAGLIGCPFRGQCGPDFVRISNNTPCVENLSYLKESWVNNRRPHHHSSSQQQYSKRHADENWSIGQARKAVDGDGGKRVPTCTVLDNFIVEKPTWMVDLGRKSTVTGLFIYARQFPDNKADTGSEFTFSLGNSSHTDKEIRHIYKDYVHNLDKLTVYVDNKGRRSEHAETSYVRGSFMPPRHTHQYANPENMCGSISRLNDALFQAKLHLRCNRQMTGRYVYIEATGIPAKNKKHFAAIICEVVVYA